MAEKSEAQKRNEDEVRRVMEQRGYGTKDYKKQQKKKFRDFSIIPKIFIGVLLIGGVGCGVFFLLSNLQNDTGTSDNISDNASYASDDATKSDTDVNSFFECYDAIGEKEFGIDDAQFWDKTISYYEEIIKCYDTYPDTAGDLELKKEIEQNLAEAIKNKEQESNTNYASSITGGSGNTGAEKNCNYEYNNWMALDSEARQAYREADTTTNNFTAEFLHEKCDNTADPVACSEKLQAEAQAKLTEAQTVLGQAQAAKQAYDNCMATR